MNGVIGFQEVDGGGGSVKEVVGNCSFDGLFHDSIESHGRKIKMLRM